MLVCTRMYSYECIYKCIHFYLFLFTHFNRGSHCVCSSVQALFFVEQTGVELTEIHFPSRSLLWVKCLNQHTKLYKYFKWKILLSVLCKATKQYVNNKKQSFEPDVPELESQHCNMLLITYWEIYILSIRILFLLENAVDDCMNYGSTEERKIKWKDITKTNLLN